jgi:hypothetical protein
MTENCIGTGSPGLFVVTSEIAVHPDAAAALSAAFRNRLAGWSTGKASTTSRSGTTRRGLAGL